MPIGVRSHTSISSFPELAITERFGPRLGQALFTVMRPFVFAQQGHALNQVRRDYGLPALPYNLPHQFTDADVTLYADVPELVPTYHRPPHHHYLGPVLWSPDSVPRWWDSLPDTGRMVYVTLGTSGRPTSCPSFWTHWSNLASEASVHRRALHPRTASIRYAGRTISAWPKAAAARRIWSFVMEEARPSIKPWRPASRCWVFPTTWIST